MLLVQHFVGRSAHAQNFLYMKRQSFTVYVVRIHSNEQWFNDHTYMAVSMNVVLSYTIHSIHMRIMISELWLSVVARILSSLLVVVKRLLLQLTDFSKRFQKQCTVIRIFCNSADSSRLYYILIYSYAIYVYLVEQLQNYFNIVISSHVFVVCKRPASCSYSFSVAC